jgi:hypothetical protein
VHNPYFERHFRPFIIRFDLINAKNHFIYLTKVGGMACRVLTFYA